MTTSYWQRSPSFRHPDVTTDVLIIGGGYAGLSTAFWLTELKPELKITVVERYNCGAGASGRNAGFLTMGSASFYKSLTTHWGLDRALDIFSFAADSLELVNEKIIRSSPGLKCERSSSMTLFRSEEQLKAWREDSFDPARFGFSWCEENRLPVHLKEKFFGAYEASPEYKINPVELLNSIKHILEERKVRIIESSSAFVLTEDGVQTETHTIKARQVVLALNAYFGQFHETFRQVIIPRRAQMLAVELEEDFDCSGLYYDPPERVYWRKIQEKVLIVGGKRLLDADVETGDFEKISPVIQKGLEDYLNKQLGLKYKILNRWSGIMGFTEHELPLLGKINAPLESYMIGGFSGHGMGLGFKSGQEMARLVCGEIKESFFNQFKRTDYSI